MNDRFEIALSTVALVVGGFALGYLLRGTPGYTPLDDDEYNLPIKTAAKLNPPSGATMATVSCSGYCRYTVDGKTAPTKDVGQRLGTDQQLQLFGQDMMRRFQVVQTASDDYDNTMTAYYFK